LARGRITRLLFNWFRPRTFLVRKIGNRPRELEEYFTLHLTLSKPISTSGVARSPFFSYETEIEVDRNTGPF